MATDKQVKAATGFVLFYFRNKKKLEQDEVAKALGMSRSNYSRMESGLISMNLETLNTLCKFYNIQMKTFINKLEKQLS